MLNIVWIFIDWHGLCVCALIEVWPIYLLFSADMIHWPNTRLLASILVKLLCYGWNSLAAILCVRSKDTRVRAALISLFPVLTFLLNSQVPFDRCVGFLDPSCCSAVLLTIRFSCGTLAVAREPFTSSTDTSNYLLLFYNRNPNSICFFCAAIKWRLCTMPTVHSSWYPPVKIRCWYSGRWIRCVKKSRLG